MPIITAEKLRDFTSRVFQAYGVGPTVADTVAESLILANLMGHDSHGVYRIVSYVAYLQKGWIDPKAELEVLQDDGAILSVDGHYGFGQVIGRRATQLAIEKTRREGACILTIRRSAHLGRIGEFMEMAADAGLVSLSLTNTHGSGLLVAPYGGCQRRLSANPIAGGAPVPGGGRIVMDMSTCAIAGGKIEVAAAKGEPLPPGCIVDNKGQPTTDPAEFLGTPPGALLPMAGHKGYALAIFADILAGAMGGGSCSKPNVAQIANGWFAIFVDPQRFFGKDFYDSEVQTLCSWLKSSAKMPGFDEILLPGEPEQRTYEQRCRQGIDIPKSTWQKIMKMVSSKGIQL